MDSALCRVVTVNGASSFVAIFEKIVGELPEDLAPRVGDLQRVTLTLRPDKAEPEESSDPAGKYFDMGLKAITFVVSQRAAAAPRRTIHPDLPRESMAGELPNWADAGHPAYDKLFQKLRGVFKEDGCLFRDVGLGKQWMLKFIKEVLYPLSTFYERLQRDHQAPVPSKFSFSAGANNFSEKKVKAPIMTQETIAVAMDAVNTLRLSLFLDADSWASLKAALQELFGSLDKALVSMGKRAGYNNMRHAIDGGFFSGAPYKEGIMYKAKADHVPPKYVELSNELQITSSYVPVSTTGFEPTCPTQRYYWLDNIALAVTCVVVNINVGGNI
ncbi:hypothetical protein M885DRAFT_581020 [Pelagophyceae sp. CCMP2097]|nr:hypothetical protein M885DRAFT_581020 [Pelagophyceae sp. CCMP2097]